MADKSYIFAVARAKALEATLFSNTDIEQLMALPDATSAIAFLSDHGWGDDGESPDLDRILAVETNKIWEAVHSFGIDMAEFDVLSYQHLYHNLKAAIKEVCVQKEVEANIFYDDCAITKEEMLRIVQEKDFQALPVHMRAVAQDALETMLMTKDGQLCDVIIDKAALESISEAGRRTDSEMLREYAKLFVALANIKIALRAAKTGKNREFIDRAMSSCDALSVERLKSAAAGGYDAVVEFLASEGYEGAADAIRESNSAFECWCDNEVIRSIRPQKYISSTVGPLIAYVLARENEIKTVRIIITGKMNDLPDEAIRERIREMYV